MLMRLKHQVGLLMFPEGMVDMSIVVDADGKGYLPDGILTNQWNPSAARTAGPKAKAIWQLRERLLLKVW